MGDTKQITEESTDNDITDEDLEQQALDDEKAELEDLKSEDVPAKIIKPAEKPEDKSEEESEDEAKPAPEITIETLTKQVESLTKSQQGTYEGLKAEKIKRQAAEDRNNRIEDAFLEIQAERAEKAEAKKLEVEAKTPAKRIAAKVDQETGEVYFEKDQLKKDLGDPTEGVTQTVDDLKAQIEYNDRVREAEKQFDEFVYDGVSSDESFIPALPKLDTALDFLKVELIGLTHKDEIIGSGRALDLLADNKVVLTEFETKFPGIDHTLVIRAYDSKIDFRKALKSIAGDKVEEIDPKPEPKSLSAADNLKKIVSLPKGLATQTNQKVETGEVDLTDYSELSQDDIDNLSDTEIVKLERALSIAQDGPQ